MRSVPLRVSCLGLVHRLACFLGGGRPGPVPPVPGLGSCAPLRAGPCVRGGPAPGGAGGGGGLCAAAPRGRGRRALRGGGLLYLGSSLCLPWASTKAGVIGVAQFMEGVASILLRFVFAYRQ